MLSLVSCSYWFVHDVNVVNMVWWYILLIKKAIWFTVVLRLAKFGDVDFRNNLLFVCIVLGFHDLIFKKRVFLSLLNSKSYIQTMKQVWMVQNCLSAINDDIKLVVMFSRDIRHTLFPITWWDHENLTW